MVYTLPKRAEKLGAIGNSQPERPTGDGHPGGATGVRQVHEVPAAHRTGWRALIENEKIPHVQHGRQPYDFRCHDLGPIDRAG